MWEYGLSILCEDPPVTAPVSITGFDSSSATVVYSTMLGVAYYLGFGEFQSGTSTKARYLVLGCSY